MTGAFAASFAANCKVIFLGVNQFREAFSEQRMIIDNHDSLCVRRIAFWILVSGSGVFH